jgi:hypothetical protein
MTSAMASMADVFLVSLLAAVVPVVIFVVLRKAEKCRDLLAALREGRRRRRRSSASPSSATSTPHSMLALLRVAPSEHGFLPARVPDFSFDNTILDGFVQVSRERESKRPGGGGFELSPCSLALLSVVRLSFFDIFWFLFSTPTSLENRL